MTKATASEIRQVRVQVAAFYKFVPLDDIEGLQQDLRKMCKASDVLGTILLAHEGINGTIAGPVDDLNSLFEFLDQYPGIENLNKKISYCNRNPFYRLKVRLKKEIVTLGVEGVDPGKAVGEYIAPECWNELISQPDVRLIDTRRVRPTL